MVFMHLQLNIRNYGRHPAILSGDPYFAITELPNKPEPRNWKDDMCGHVEHIPGMPGTVRFPHPIFQGVPIPRTIYINQPVTAQDAPISNRRLYNDLSGCIVYNSMTGGPYKVRVIYRLLYDGDIKTSLEESDIILSPQFT